MLPLIGVPAPVQGTPLQSAGIVAVPGPPGRAPTFESEDIIPAGVSMSVVGCSADADHALPHGPTMVYRTCGMREPPVEPMTLPNSNDSLSASPSEKF